MTDIHAQLRKADRLATITQRVGFALWQLQELESATAQYYVLAALATKGMGFEAGSRLDETAQGKTFGTTIHALRKAGKMPEALESRFLKLLGERNWLVHSSRSTSRTAVHSDADCESLLCRLEKIAEEARLLLKEVGSAAERFAISNGVLQQEIDRLTQEVLASWHDGNMA